jgi:sodium-dependent dicarboxylate transporter 2/3/5
MPPSPLPSVPPVPWWRRPRLVALAAPLLVLAPLARAQGWDAESRALLVGGTALACWLTEWTPGWLPTLLLWLGVPLLFAGLGDAWAAPAVLGWSADPVLVLFLGGFALAGAARAQGLDRRLAAAALALARGDAWRLVVASALATWALSMWMSNIAAAALMLGAVAPVLDTLDARAPLRRALLLAIAMAANTGGIATPIGTGPNAIAIAAAAPVHRIAFVEWMAFGVPLAAGLLGATLLALRWTLRPAGAVTLAPLADATRGARAGRVTAIGALAIAAWLTEPLHGVAAWRVAGALVLVLLATRALPVRALRRIDWATLVLIAGGLALGGLLETSGLLRHVARVLSLDVLAPTARVALLVLVAAIGSALMSNTATATILVPLAWSIAPSPATAVLVAVGCSLGVPFVVSTPPNAMAVARGLPSRDLLVVGVPLMLAGCALVALTGPRVLGWLLPR